MAALDSSPAVSYIDPNRIFDKDTVFEGHGKIPNYEDYCISLNIEVEQSSRTFQASETAENRVMLVSWVSNENKNNVSFMSGTKVMSHTPNVYTTKGYEMTYQDIQDYGVTEMLGIKSVNIEYEKYCVPQITVVFTDIRGFSLMAPNELERETEGKMNSKNVVANFFKAFFMMPPAKFTFTIKGFYGKPVTYETTCIDFRASFDSETGDFNANVKFIGYQFSFLTDVSVNALIAAPYSDYIGKDYWEAQKANGRFVIPSKDGSMVPMPTLSELKQNFEEIIAANDTNAVDGSGGGNGYDYGVSSSDESASETNTENSGADGLSETDKYVFNAIDKYVENGLNQRKRLKNEYMSLGKNTKKAAYDKIKKVVDSNVSTEKKDYEIRNILDFTSFNLKKETWRLNNKKGETDCERSIRSDYFNKHKKFHVNGMDKYYAISVDAERQEKFDFLSHSQTARICDEMDRRYKAVDVGASPVTTYRNLVKALESLIDEEFWQSPYMNETFEIRGEKVNVGAFEGYYGTEYKSPNLKSQYTDYKGKNESAATSKSRLKLTDKYSQGKSYRKKADTTNTTLIDNLIQNPGGTLKNQRNNIRLRAPQDGEKNVSNSSTDSQETINTITDTSPKPNVNSDDLKRDAGVLKQVYSDWYKSLFDVLKQKYDIVFKEDDVDAGVCKRVYVLVKEDADDTLGKFFGTLSNDDKFFQVHYNTVSKISEFNKEYKKDISVPSDDMTGYEKFKLLKPLKTDPKNGEILFNGFVENDGLSSEACDGIKTNVKNSIKKIYSDGTSQYLWCYMIDNDMYALNDILGAKIDEPEISQKEAERLANDELMSKMVWYPSIENFTRILMAHVETLMRMMYNAVDSIIGSRRTPEEFGVTLGKNGICSDVKDGSQFLPPFPRFTRIVKEDEVEKHEDAWIGNWPSNGNTFEEVNLINGLLNGASEVSKLENITKQKIAQESRAVPSGNIMKQMHPLSFFDMVVSTDADVFGGAANINTLTDLMWMVSMRMYGTLCLSSFRGIDDGWLENANAIGAVDAENFYNTRKINENLLKQLGSVDVDKMLSIITDGSGVDEYKVNGTWPWARGDVSAIFNPIGDELEYCLYTSRESVACPIVMKNQYDEINSFLELSSKDIPQYDFTRFSNIAANSPDKWVKAASQDNARKAIYKSAIDSKGNKTSFFNVFEIGEITLEQKMGQAGSSDVTSAVFATINADAGFYYSEDENGKLYLDNDVMHYTEEDHTPFVVDDVYECLTMIIIRTASYNWGKALSYLNGHRIWKLSKVVVLQVGYVFQCLYDGYTESDFRKKVPSEYNFNYSAWKEFYDGMPFLTALWFMKKYLTYRNSAPKILAGKNGNVNEIVMNHKDLETRYICGNALYYSKNNRRAGVVRTIKKEIARNYISGFFQRLATLVSGQDQGSVSNGNVVSTTQEANGPKQLNEDMKIALYIYLKQLYDKWIPLATWDSWHFEKFFDGNSDKERQDPHGHTFYFIDSYYTKIGHALLLNPQVVNDRMDAAMYQNDYKAMLLPFMSDIYAGHKCMFMSVQNFRDLTAPNAMEDMFDPVPFSRIHMIQKHPDFVVIYPYSPSTNANLRDGKYEDDGFMLNDPNDYPRPLRVRSARPGEKWFTIPAFGVQYGQQYQHMFKKIDVNMNNPITTEQTIKAKFSIGNMYGKANDRKAITAAQDLYDVFSTYSYTCNITMMGCAWVQPLMYLVLLNIPMFKGSYLIYKVSHQMVPGDMTTTITANKMCSVSTPLVKDVYTDVLGDGDHDDYMTRKRNELAAPTNDCPYKVYPLWESGNVGETQTNLLNASMKDSDDGWPRAKQFIQFFTTTNFEGNGNKPYNLVQACAVAGNVMKESGFDKNSARIDSNGFASGGLAQWNGGAATEMLNNEWRTYGSRANVRMSKGALITKLQKTTDEYQMKFLGNSIARGIPIHYEKKGGPKAGSFTKWKNMTDVSASAMYFGTCYEAPYVVEEKRAKYAASYYAKWLKENGRSETMEYSTPAKTKVGFCGDSWMVGYMNNGNLGTLVSDKYDAVFKCAKGAKSSSVKGFVNEAISDGCTVIVINCGINDCLAPGKVIGITNGIDTKRIKVFLCTVPLKLNAVQSSCKEKLNDVNYVKKFNDTLKKSSGANRYGIIDLASVQGVECTDFHPNAASYQKLAKFIADNIGNALQYSPTTDNAGNEGTGHGDIKTAFFNAVNKSFSFSTGGKTLKRSDNGDKMVLTTDGDRLGLAFDIILNGYYEYVRSLYWIYTNEKVGGDPNAIEVEVSEDLNGNTNKRVVGANPKGSSVYDIPKDVSDDFYRALVKRYRSDSDGNLGAVANKEVKQRYDKEKVKAVSITSCDELLAPFMEMGSYYNPLVCGQYTGGARQRQSPNMAGVTNSTLKKICEYSHTATTWSHGANTGDFTNVKGKGLCASGVEAIFAKGGVGISAYWGGGLDGYPHRGVDAWKDTFFEKDSSWQKVWNGSFADYRSGSFRSVLRPGDAVAMFYTGGGGDGHGGHACMWNGSEWVSDYRQKNGIMGAIPGDYPDRCGKNSFNIYRYTPFWQ